MLKIGSTIGEFEDIKECSLISFVLTLMYMFLFLQFLFCFEIFLACLDLDLGA